MCVCVCVCVCCDASGCDLNSLWMMFFKGHRTVYVKEVVNYN